MSTCSKFVRVRNVVLIAIVALMALSVAPSHTQARLDMATEIRVAVVRGDMTDAIAPLVDKYEAANPGVTITVEMEPEGGDFTPLIAAGNQPDLIFPALSATLGTLASQDAAVPLDDLPSADEVFASVEPASLQELYGYHYYVPVSADATLMIYNRDLFKEAGLDPDKPPVTWDEFLTDAAAISALPDRESGDKVYGTVFWNEALSWGGWYWNMLQPIYLNANQGKCQLLNHLGTDVVFDKEECHLADFFTFLKEAQKYAPPDMSQNFFGRNIGMWMQFGYGWQANLDSAEPPMVVGEDVGIAPIPVQHEGDTSFTTYGGRAMMILKTTPDREARAWDFLKFMMQEENNRDFIIALQNLPSLTSLKADPYFQDPLRLPFVQSLENGKIPELYATAERAAVELQGIYQQVVIDGAMSPEDGVTEAAANARKVLKEE